MTYDISRRSTRRWQKGVSFLCKEGQFKKKMTKRQEDYDDEMDRLLNESSRAMFLDKGPAEGDLLVTGLFQSYQSYSAETGFHNNPEPPQAGRTKLCIDGSQMPVDLEFGVQIDNMNTVKGVCEPFPGGVGWYVKHEVFYLEKPDCKARSWMEENAVLYRAGSYTHSFPIQDYLVPDSTELVTHVMMPITAGQVVKFKTKDGGPYREKWPTGGNRVVSEINMEFVKCFAKITITLKKDKQKKKKKDAPPVVDKYSPQAYLSIECKGASKVLDDNVAKLPETLRMHQNRKKDRHTLIPFDDFKAGSPAPVNIYLYVKQRYSSPQGTEQGVTIGVKKPQDLSCYSNTYQDKKSGRYYSSLLVAYWRGDVNTNRQQYFIDIRGSKRVWTSWGITDLTHYEVIMKANYDLPYHAMLSLKKEDTLLLDVNNKPEMRRPEIQGTYIFDVGKIVPDLAEYFPRAGFRISREALVAEFERGYASTTKYGDKLTLVRTKVSDESPETNMNDMGLRSPVISLGNGLISMADKEVKWLYCAFGGDIWPVVDECDFYVLTSVEMTAEEKARYCGPQRTCTVAEADEHFQKLKLDGALYWIYALNKGVLGLEKFVQPPLSVPKQKKRR